VHHDTNTYMDVYTRITGVYVCVCVCVFVSVLLCPLWCLVDTRLEAMCHSLCTHRVFTTIDIYICIYTRIMGGCVCVRVCGSECV